MDINDKNKQIPVDLVDDNVNSVRVLVLLGTGVAKIGMVAVLFSRRVLGVAGESKSLSARTPLYGGDMGCRAFALTNRGFLGLVLDWILNPSPSSLPDESSLSELELLNSIGSDVLEEVVEDASSCKSSSSLMGNSSR